jgi:hypothetical protein
MAKKTPAKKTPAKQAATAQATGAEGNLAALTKAGVVPEGYKRFTPTEKTAIESLSETEVAAIISTKTKMGTKFFPKHASHGMFY